MIKHTVCPACHSQEIYPVKHFELPAILFPIEKEKRFQIPFAPLQIYACDICGHLFSCIVDKAFTQKIYADYYYLYPFENLETMSAYYRKPFENVFKMVMFGLDAQYLLEIGCASERQMESFVRQGFRCVGVSPGARPSERIQMIDGFYEQVSFKEQFDVIVSRFNLEHILDVDDFFKRVLCDLKQRGKLFIQVPNVEQFLHSGYLNIFAHEHSHYFCAASLRALLQRNDFDVEVLIGTECPALIAVASPARHVYQPREMLVQSDDVIEQIRGIIAANSSRQIVFYGAGMSLTGILYNNPKEPGINLRAIVVDDNPVLKGRFMPGTNYEVISFDASKIEPSAIVFLTLAPIYHEAVIKRLRNTLVTTVFAITPTGVHAVNL